ncbi:hypothetical protein [Streptomyces sp. NPDC001787]|uniref:hypothetical protein n=1 Tax=Streptomyces sp. NPDC001787 TaxID=3154523 RepID=UPI00332C0538
MYEIREMLPADQPAVGSLWRARVRWAAARGLGPIRYVPLTPAERAAAEPVVLVGDQRVVAVATVIGQTPRTGWTERESAQRAVGVVRMVTDPALSADRLSWILTSWITDFAARTGHDWVRLQVASHHLAQHLRTTLAWNPVRRVRTADGGQAYLMQRRAEPIPGIRALVEDQTGPRSPFVIGSDFGAHAGVQHGSCAS